MVYSLLTTSTIQGRRVDATSTHLQPSDQRSRHTRRIMSHREPDVVLAPRYTSICPHGRIAAFLSDNSHKSVRVSVIWIDICMGTLNSAILPEGPPDKGPGQTLPDWSFR
jgi:hypothetical protein